MSKISVELTGEYEFLEDNGKIYAEMTDFSFITILSNSSSKFGSYYVSLTDPSNMSFVSRLSGIIIKLEKYGRSYGLRPVLNIEDIPQEVIDKGKKLNDQALLIEYGYFPQSRVKDVSEENDIKDKISNKTINETGKYYSMISMQDKVYCLPCYEDNGKFYVKIDTSKIDEESKIPKYYVIEVEPVKWLVDLKTGKVISENVLIANIPFSLTSSTDYENSYVKKYLEEIFLSELLQFEKTKVNKPLIDKVMNIDKDDESVTAFFYNITTKNIADKARILTTNEVFKNPCEIIKKVGTKAATTDFSIATGGAVSKLYYVNGKSSRDNRVGFYLLNSETTEHVSRVSNMGMEMYIKPYNILTTSQRIVLPFNDINIMKYDKSDNDFFEVEYGFYPQMVVSKDISDTLMLKLGSLKKTGKKYRYYNKREYDKPFEQGIDTLEEYDYEGKRYVLMRMQDDGELSDGEKYNEYQQFWIEVMPVKWYVSKKDNMMVSEKSLFSGIPYRSIEFENSYVNNFIKEIFMKDLLQDRNYKIIKEEKKESESKKLDFTFLTLEQVYGNSNDKLSPLAVYGTIAKETDFCMFSKYSSLYGGGTWWLKTSNDSDNAYYVSERGINFEGDVDYKNRGVRPSISYSAIKEYSKVISEIGNIKEIGFGFYPQTVVSDDEAKILENKYQNDELDMTGKTYTQNQPYNKLPEYEDDSGKYIRLIGNNQNKNNKLSKDRCIELYKPYWIKVEPIIWYVDEKRDVAFSQKILFSGIPFNEEKTYDGNFETTYIKKFMDSCFAKEILPESISKTIFDISEVKKVTKEESTNLGKKICDIVNWHDYLDDELNKVIDLIRSGADVNYRDNNGISPLLACAGTNAYNTAEILIKAGANVNLTDNNLCTSLMYAIINEHYEMFNLLLNSGCDLNLRDKKGYTALMYAKENGLNYMFDKLIEKGALINILNNNNESIFDIESDSIDDSFFKPKKKVECEDAIELLNEAQDRLNNLLGEDSNESIHEKVLKLF